MAKDKEAAAKGDTKEAAATEEKKSTKAEKPEGFVSPYKFADLLSEELGREIRPQTIYAQVRNKPKLEDGTEFPVETNTDGKYMINVEDGLAWYKQRLSEREASKKAKADKEATAEASE